MRGGTLGASLTAETKLTEKAIRDHAKTGRWAISIASVPGLTAAEIAKESSIIKGYKRICVGRAGELMAEGFRVESDGKGKIHGILHLGGEPSREMWERLRVLMPERDNPHYRGGDNV